MFTIQLLQRVSLALSVFFALCYLYQTAYLFLPLLPRRKRRAQNEQAPRLLNYAVLIAARNEQAVLPYLLDSIRDQDYAGSITTYVIADNCTDATAAVAREHGAIFYERHDTVHVGKGYALNALIGHIRAAGELERYDAFLIFDADNLLCPDYVTEMNKVFSQGHQAVGGYRNSKNFMENWVSAGSALWYIHDSAHLNASRMRLGVTCAVTGTGFGFTRELLERCGGWQFFTLVEDVEFDTWCAVNGVRIAYCPTAMVYDEQPSSFRQSWRQRTRWVRGGIQVSLKYGRRLIRGMFRGGLRRRHGCFENLTLTLYGYGGCALAGALASVTALLAGGTGGLVRGVVLPLAWMYGGLFVMGALTTVMERRRIPGTVWQKVKSCLTFPLFMLTYIPVAMYACVAKPQWKPIRHTVAVGLDKIPKSAAMTKM